MARATTLRSPKRQGERPAALTERAKVGAVSLSKEPFQTTDRYPMMSNRQRITLLIYSMTNAVIFGAGVIAVLSLPSLNADAAFWIPVVVVASFILAAPVAWLVAPRLQARYDRRVAERERERVRPS